MRTAHRIAALLWLAPCVVPGCATQVQGELMLAIQTDMALPKDIDRIRITVANVKTGEFAFQKDFEKVGESASIKLPSTLGILAPKDPSDAVKIRVIASRSSDTAVRVLREVVTTVPTDRSAMLPIKIEFLCDGTGKAALDEKGQVKRDADGIVEVESTCPAGLTCVAGTCVTSEVPSAKLLTFDAAQIFGGGTGTGDGACFDTAGCFDAATDLAPPTKIDGNCIASASGSFNVGLRTQGGGICNASGCFVALDAESDAGWQPGPKDGQIQLPTAVCDKVGGDIVAVVTAPVDKSACQQKRISIPTCGPWSATGKSTFPLPDPKQPTLVASGQSNPVALAVALGSIYWTSQGKFDDKGVPSGGAVKAVSIDGGQPRAIGGAEQEAAPRGITVDIGRQFVLWTTAGDGKIRWAPFVDETGATTAHDLLQATGQPEGIAVSSGASEYGLYWTELAGNKVTKVSTAVQGSTLTTKGAAAEITGLPTQVAQAPHDIAVTTDGACWTYEDMLGSSGGAVACSFTGASQQIAGGERTPRAIAMSTASGKATAVYWANFDAKAPDANPDTPGGGIYMASLPPTMTPTKVRIAQEDYPAGLVVDGQTLYWTSRTQGTVMRLAPGAMPVAIATGQQNPGAIAVDAKNVYWINEGKSTSGSGAAPDGAIMKIAK